ncbi:MAG: glycosyltransferase [Cellvibrionales bacterium]|nr:glycosyltransferase [Cellvibrionales bacterium]
MVPVFNERDHCRSCYLLAATGFSAFHLIFVDNASTDGSVEFIKSIRYRCLMPRR